MVPMRIKIEQRLFVGQVGISGKEILGLGEDWRGQEGNKEQRDGRERTRG